MAAQESENCSFLFLAVPTHIETVDFGKVKIAV